MLSHAVQTHLTAPARWPSGEGGVLMEHACGQDRICGWVSPSLPTACKCDNNQQIFKGIISRYLGYLLSYVSTLGTHPDQATAITEFLTNNANSVLANNKAAAGSAPAGYGLFWPVFPPALHT